MFGYGKTFLGKICDGQTNLIAVSKAKIIKQKNPRNTHITSTNQVLRRYDLTCFDY